MEIELDDIIGQHICYADYNGIECYGTVIAFEVANIPSEEPIVYLYIEDDNDKFNIHEDIVNGTLIKYSEIRLSTEVIIDN